MKVRPSRLTAVAEAISSHKSVGHVAIVSGSFGMSMAGVFHDSREKYRFATEGLGAIPGVTGCESMNIAKFVKLSYSFLT